jgi:hypothetical protein
MPLLDREAMEEVRPAAEIFRAVYPGGLNQARCTDVQ